jgi:hypothetical protein
MLGMAQAKRVDALLPMTVSGLVERADFALARIWLVETPNSHAEDKERFLRLSASEGCSQVDGRNWNGIEGEFSKIRLGALKIGYIAQHAAPLHLDEHEIKHSHWTASPDWVAAESLRDNGLLARGGANRQRADEGGCQRVDRRGISTIETEPHSSAGRH